MTALARYDVARQALADARQIDEVMSIRDDAERMKLYARQAKDREMMADAVEIRLRAERQLGVLLKAAKEAGQIAEGRRPKQDNNCQDDQQFPRVTLEEAGIDRNLSSVAQKRASISEQAFEMVVNATRERMLSDKAKIIEESALPRGARAIMGSREEPDDSLDHFPTPPWATRALIEHVFAHMGRKGHCKFQDAWEPGCGEGHMAAPLSEYFRKVYASDIYPYGYGEGEIDFLATRLDGFDWIITNPPFGTKTEDFVLHALTMAGTGVAMFVRLQWLESVGRYEAIFLDHPPTLIAFFAERVPLKKGTWDPKGSTATAYIWLVWIKGAAPQAPFWIPPGCRAALSRPEDAKRFRANAEGEAA